MTIYKKKADRQTLLNSKPEHPVFLKQHTLQSKSKVQRICLTVTEFQQQSKKIMEKFIQRGYKASDTKTKIWQSQ